MSLRLFDENRPEPDSIGLMAGWGTFPIVVARALKAAGHTVSCVGIAGHADPILEEICDHYLTCQVARLGQQIRFLKRHDVRRATLAGKLFKDRLLLQKMGWLSLLPDFRTICAFAPIYFFGRRNRSDDTLMNVVVDEFARDGIELAPATDFSPELLVKHGLLTRRKPSAAELADIRYGWQVAKEMGRIDIGQSVAVKGRVVVAVEAIEGTDSCIRRAGELCPQGGFTVVKVAKPQQDMRFDVPTIGKLTIETMIAAGAKVLAIEAGKTILLDEPEVAALANKHGLSIISLHESDALQDAA